MPIPRDKTPVVDFYPDVPEAEIADLMHGAVDLHCHSGPSVMPRCLNHLEAIRDAEAAGMHAILFKDHYYSVTPVVALLKEISDIHITMFTGVPLNNSTGGLNPYAVEHGLQLGARMVWMPTFSAANHIRQGHRHTILPTKSRMLPPTGITIVSDRGELKDEVKQILDLIAAHDAVLSGGVRIAPAKLRFSIYEARTETDGDRALIIPDVRPNTVVRLNSGTYHVVSTYGSVNAVIRSDIRVEAGKLTEATVEHRAAELTLKLVREAGGEAIADTSWSILSESGDPVRESVGAFASMVLAEGDYTIVAKNRDRIYQRDFTVVGGRNQEVEVLADDAVSADAGDGAD